MIATCIHEFFVPLSQLSLQFVNSNRVCIPQIEEQRDQEWQALLDQAKDHNKLLYNEINYRYEGVTNHTVLLSPIEYKTIATLKLHSVELMDKIGISAMPCNLAVGGFVVSSDGYYIFGKLSGKTQSIHGFDFVGGGIENDGEAVPTLESTFYDELRQESGIQKNQIEKVAALGIMQTKSGYAVLLTHCKCTLSLSAVLQQFEQEHDHEMSELVYCKAADLPNFLATQHSYHSDCLPILTEYLHSNELQSS